MIRSSVGRLFMATFAALFMTGCVTSVDGVTFFSTRNVDMAATHEPAGPRISDRESRLWIAFIPLGSEPQAKLVANELLEKSKADYLRNVSFDFGGFSLIAISYGWVKVEGDPWRAGKGSSPVPATAPPKAP